MQYAFEYTFFYRKYKTRNGNSIVVIGIITSNKTFVIL